VFHSSKFVSCVVKSDKCNLKNTKPHFTTLLFTNDFNLPTLMAFENSKILNDSLYKLYRYTAKI